MHELPSTTWERFLSTGDESELIAILDSPPMREPIAKVEYPEIHRLCDVSLGGRAYRVSRLVDLHDKQERLFIKPTEVPDFAMAGVPYVLQGAPLRRWIRDEIEFPADGPISWDEYGVCQQ